MSRSILVPANAEAPDSPAYAAAFAVAKRFAAAEPAGVRLRFLHLRPDIAKETLALVSADFAGGIGYADMIDAGEKEADRHTEAAAAAVRNACAAQGVVLGGPAMAGTVSAEWASEIGTEADVLAAHGRCADLVVMARDAMSGQPAPSLLEVALMETGRPLLIAPRKPQPVIGDVIAIAWKDTRESALAVAAAAPFLARARQIVILSVVEGAAGEDASAERLRRTLQLHANEVSVKRLEPRQEDLLTVLLGGVAVSGADLLVMGGYGHSRMREAVFGGFTRAVLRDAGLAVLMAH